MDFLLRELHGLIKWNPWQKTTCYFSLYLMISVKRENAINFGGKEEKRWFWTFQMTFLCKHYWEIGVRTTDPRDNYFSCSRAQTLLLLHPGFWNCAKLIWVKKGTKRELLENCHSLPRSNAIFFRKDEMFALKLNWSVITQGFLALYRGSLVCFVLDTYQDLYLDCQNWMNILRYLA